MGENIGRIFKASEDSVIALGDEGRILPVYSMGDSVGRAYLIGNGDEGST